MKIVLNKCYGCFSISKQAAEYMVKLGSKQAKAELKQAEKESRWYGYGSSNEFADSYDRTDKYLVKAVEKLGAKANGQCADLKVIKIPDGINYEIEQYDGMESIRETHRSWS